MSAVVEFPKKEKERLVWKSAILRVLKRSYPEILAALIVMRNDGTMSVWNDRMDTAEHRRWFDGQIDVARKMIFPNDPA